MTDSAGGSYCTKCGQYILMGQMHTCPAVYYVGGQYCYRCGEFYLNGTFHTCKDMTNTTGYLGGYQYNFYFVTKEEIDSLNARIKTLEEQMEKLCSNIDFYFRASSLMDRVDKLLGELEHDRAVQDNSV